MVTNYYLPNYFKIYVHLFFTKNNFYLGRKANYSGICHELFFQHNNLSHEKFAYLCYFLKFGWDFLPGHLQLRIVET